MKLEIILGVLRHILTGLGGVLVAKGWADDSQIGEAAGALCTLIGFGWSVWHKRQAELKAAVPLLALCCLGALCGCVSATGTKTISSANGVTTTETIVVKGFLSTITDGTYSCSDGSSNTMTLATTSATPDQQSIAILAGGIVDLGKVGLGLLTKNPFTNSPAAGTNILTQPPSQ